MTGRRLLFAVPLALAIVVLIPAASLGATLSLTRITAINTGVGGSPGIVRTKDGALRVVYSTQVAWSGGFDGVGVAAISPSGHVGPRVRVLSGWKTGVPGVLVTATGALETVFGGNPDVGGSSYAGPWGSTSFNGGVTWSGASAGTDGSGRSTCSST